jgi:hypothetical protein
LQSEVVVVLGLAIVKHYAKAKQLLDNVILGLFEYIIPNCVSNEERRSEGDAGVMV